MADKFDLVVIGAGPGGYEAAVEGVQKGMKVALVENREMGGTCLNRGCIPTKTILHTAELYHDLQSGPSIGLTAREPVIDMEMVQKRKDEVLEQLRKGIASLMKTNRISVFYGTGTILDREHVKVALSGEKAGEKAEEQPDGQKQDQVVLETGHILIATGSVPACPPIPGSSLSGVVTSDGLLDKKDLFEHLIIIGGGVIGMEFASVYSSLGHGVTVIEALDRILPTMDKEIAQNLKMIMKKRNVDIHTGAKVEEILRTEDGAGLICRYVEKDKPCEARADGILIAAGRRAYTGGLITDESSQEVKDMAMERGRIVTDEKYQTSVPGIYAVGDVTGGIQLAHAATAQGRNAVAHMAGENMVIRTDIVPSCVYTNPEIGCVGISADEAKARGIEAVTKKYIMSANGKSILSQQERGFIKVVADSDSHRILGAQMMCARATDMISQFAVAIANELTLEDMAKVIFPHPTFSEGILEAVR
ncbi:dihydrolipoyl dehydrogenase [Enterocloster clostridioformis]|uniref:dihydrolipoyl dehydrogenase n=1 Tax=Enterocloster clostridioformis TaxID=1531 RepID=UPI00080C92F4|nr:dihydrolipoyl dehydrogenase [Enterocloster clostridioformis]ANU47471.1 dihydrolipoyl dehydrogenase [Lachnoclostridium sp. YL32]NDO30898.1 dihydrolipoyl dehydrogenase [Enterocloster clostridioformis]OXE66338.1 dihydrolipoyl dehydrogenase [Enterocloster clostridioformis]QQR03631.1 dihydrolipoyl dehydrogenase [Enterocloster clostridioformis]